MKGGDQAADSQGSRRDCTERGPACGEHPSCHAIQNKHLGWILAADNFLAYARKNYVGVGADGKLQWVTNYYDPLVNFKFNSLRLAGCWPRS